MIYDAIAFRSGKLYQGKRPYLWVVRADPPQAWVYSEKMGWKGANEPPFDVNMTHLTQRAQNAQEACGGFISGYAQDVESNQLFLGRDFVPKEIWRWSAFRQTWLNGCEYYSSIPPEARRYIGRLRIGQYPLWGMFYRAPEAMELFESNPLLAWMLAHRKRYLRKPSMRWAEVRALASQKRRDILQHLGFTHCVDAAARILSRVPASEITHSLAYWIREAMREKDVLHRLCHIPRINRSVVRIASDNYLRSSVSMGVLQEIGANPWEDEEMQFPYMLMDLRLLGQFSQRRIRRFFRNTREIRNLYLEHKHEIEELHDQGLVVPISEFPPPPVQETEFIHAIRTPAALLQEARAQSNCCATLAPEIARNGIYLYKCLAPERATVAIAHSGGHWMLEECLLRKNAKPLEQTASEVARWLAAAQGLHPEDVLQCRRAN